MNRQGRIFVDTVSAKDFFGCCGRFAALQEYAQRYSLFG
jgi:hypothetical protein